MQNTKVKSEQLSQPISEYPPNYSSISHEPTEKKEERGNLRFISNITCPARKAFYVPEFQKFHWNDSRAPTRSEYPPHYSSRSHEQTKKKERGNLRCTSNTTCPARKAFHLPEAPKFHWNDSRATTRSEYPPHYSSRSHEQTKKKERGNLRCPSNITCLPRKSFYVPEFQKFHWNASRATTSTVGSSSTMKTTQARRRLTLPKGETEMKPLITSDSQRSKFKPTKSTPQFVKMEAGERCHKNVVGGNQMTTKINKPARSPSNAWFKTHAVYSIPDTQRRSMVHRNSSASQTWTPNHHHSYGFGEFSFRPKRQEIPSTPGIIPRPRHKYNDIFSSAPHLKYGMFGKRKCCERTQIRQQTKIPRSPQNEIPRRDNKRKTVLIHKEEPSNVYRKKNLTISEIMHVDIKPIYSEKKSPQMQRYNRNIIPYGHTMPSYGNASPPFRYGAGLGSPIRCKKTSQSLRNIKPGRKKSLPFKSSSLIRNWGA